MNHEDGRACQRCFQDKALVDLIHKEGKRGWCDWCGARNVYVISLYELGEMFREVASLYEPSEREGDPISFLLQEDWKIFSDKIEQAPDNLMQELTVAILESGLDPKDFTDYPNYDEGFRKEDVWLVDHWHDKAEAYFKRGEASPNPSEFSVDRDEPGYAGFPDFLESAFENLSTSYEPGKILYRARMHKDRSRSERFQLVELGAPPSDKTPEGRANRKGEPVLYLASDAPTALSEVRAWKGTAVAIGKIEVKKRLFVVSLLDYELPKSPFFDELLRWKLQLADLFDRLSYELSMPVMPQEEDQLYFSTQFLCDWVRNSGYDGMEYPSAMGQGFNIVVFKPENAEPVDSEYVRVTGIGHTVQKVKDNEPIYEEGPFDYLFRK
jgi:hypothetical protein